jgi:1-acyl-sn-glycerol-3-phosphate acyltransferase
MFRARHIKAYTAFFHHFTRWTLKHHFHHLNSELEHPDRSKSLLVIANHFSWWDGFIVYYLNDMYFRKRFHVMMLEEELVKRMFLNKAGAFSIRKPGRSIIESLEYAGNLLSSPGNMLLMFPQGEFQSQYHRGFKFDRGIEKIIEKSKNDPEILFNINLVEYFQHPSPTLYMRTRIYTGARKADPMRSAFTDFHASCLSRHKQMKQC